MGHFLNDVHQSLRTVARSPLFSLTVVLILALGIAANCAVFSIIQRTLLNPIPTKDPQQLMVIGNAHLSSTLDGMPSPGSPMLDWGSLLRPFESLAAYSDADDGLNLSDGGEAERIEVSEVSVSFFQTFRVNASLGRTFLAEEELSGQNRVAVLSHALWQKRYGADGGIIGKTIRLNEVPYIVVGVASPEFRFPRQTDLWIPISLGKDRIFTGRGVSYRVIGRLRPEADASQAQLEARALRQRFQKENPAIWLAFKEMRIVPLLETLVGNIRLSLLLLWGAVGLVQLIVCANVANLMLNRGLTRRRELAVRAALGASSRMLFRQLLIESLMLSLIAGLAGIIGSYGFLKFIAIYTPTSVAFLKDAGLDSTAVAFTIGLSLVTGIIFGLAPGFQAMRIDLEQALKEGQRQGSESSRFSRLRSLLVVFEVALALVLLIGAGLLIGSFKQVLKIESGVNASNVFTATIALPKAKYTDPVKTRQFFNDLISRLREYPAVRSIGAISALPMGTGGYVSFMFEIIGRPKDRQFGAMFANDLAVTPDYFPAIGIPLIQGRAFTDQDLAQTQRVVIINQSFAKKFWPNESPIGKQLQIVGNDVPAEIIGVVGDVKYSGLERGARFEMYSSYLQSTVRPTTLVIRTESDPLKYVAAVRKEVQALDPNLPIYDTKTMEQWIDESTGNRRFITLVLGILAAIAIILAGGGIYGVTAYSVSQRTHEIGIRTALGAGRRQILSLVIGKAMILTFLGAVVGIVSAILLTRVMAGLLYGLQATDIPTFSVTTLGLFAITFLASFVPAYRATRIDPLVTLRYE